MTLRRQPTPEPRFDHFYRYDELTRLLLDYADACPELLRVQSIGKSHEGRDIWLAVLTNFASGADIEKPAFWVRRQHPRRRAHGEHRVPVLAAPPRHLLRRRRAASSSCSTRAPSTSARGSTRTAPSWRWPIRRATSARSTRPYPYDEPPVDGLTIEDIDGDGRILTMRIRDPHGAYKKHPDEPRLMIAREPGEFGGEYFRLIPEGTLIELRRAHGQGQSATSKGWTSTATSRRNGARNSSRPAPGRIRPASPRCGRWSQFITAHPNIGAGGELPHPQRRDPAAARARTPTTT